MERIYQIQRTPDGAPTFNVGGGACHKTFSGITVLSPDKKLKDPIFIRVTGHRANRNDQAQVEVEIGDLIVTMQGDKPVEKNNPLISLNADQIIKINDEQVLTVPAEIRFTDIPEKVIEGLSNYHNQKGSYFVSGDQ